MRGQKGITLVALIITIVVLLILAVVAVTTISETGIMDRSNQAATTYNSAVANEGNLINTFNSYIDSYLNS